MWGTPRIGNRAQVGSWAHPKRAVFFARWLGVRFAVWCDAMIDDILKGRAQVTITKPQESAVMALPQDYEGALEALLLSVRNAKVLAVENVQLVALVVADYVDALTSNVPKTVQLVEALRLTAAHSGFASRPQGQRSSMRIASGQHHRERRPSRGLPQP